ncbi:MAG TPA: HlyD family efflux transporter periplasmic adaptor subunit, partial [Allocoleopsis sp.]
KASVRNLELSSNDDKPQAQLTALQKDITLKQLEVQEKALDMNKKVTGLQAALAGVNAQTMLPASPFAGVVQRIYVRPGQQVNPGTVLAEVSSPDQKITAVVHVPEEVVRNMTLNESSDIYLDDSVYSVTPIFISQEATDGLLYSVIFVLDSDAPVTDGEYVTMRIPVGTSTTHKAVPFIPIDAVYQTQDKSYLLVVRDHKAVSREVKLGTLFGSYVEITTGLQSGDRVILDRTVVEGEEVKTK